MTSLLCWKKNNTFWALSFEKENKGPYITANLFLKPYLKKSLGNIVCPVNWARNNVFFHPGHDLEGTLRFP